MQSGPAQHSVRIVRSAICVAVAALLALVPVSELCAQASLGGHASADSAVIIAIEAAAARFPRNSRVPEVPASFLHRSTELQERLGPLPEMVGTAERRCVDVPPREGIVVRSGDFLVGGRLVDLIHDRAVKIWWQPLAASMDLRLLVRGRRLGAAGDTLHMESDNIVAPLDSETHEPFVEEAGFPTGPVFPSAGKWVAVATAGRNWGCFVFPVR